MGKRYFLAFYLGYNAKENTVNGCSCIETNDGYLNEKITLEAIIKEAKLISAVITNIIELSESDFKDFIK